MIFPTPMKYLAAAVLDADADAVSRELLRLGVLQFVDVRSLDRSLSLRQESANDTRRRVAEVRRRVETTLATGNFPLPEHIPADPGKDAFGPDAAERLVDEVTGEVDSLRNRQRELQQQIMRYEELGRQVSTYGAASRATEAVGGRGYLDVRAGSIPADRLGGLRQELSSYPATDVELGHSDDRVEILLLSLKRNQAAVDEIRKRYGWQEVELPGADQLPDVEPGSRVQQQLESARAEQQRVGRQVVETVEKRKPELEHAWRSLRHAELLLDVRSYFEHTDKTVVFSGWVPKEYVQQVDEAVRRVTEQRCYLTWHAGQEMEKTQHVKVPVRLKNPRLLKPFQMLVENFGTPEYGTVDPTILVAVAYLIMFGLMFADAGHGLVLLAGGLLGLRSPSVTGRMRELFGLLTWCAVSAIAFGVLFGAYFGMQLFPPLWFDFHGVVSGHAESGAITSIFDILGLTIYLGIAVIGLGFVLNWINLARARKWLDIFFDRAGLLTAWLYAGGIYAAYEFVQSNYRELPAGGELVVALVAPALLLLLKEPAQALFAPAGEPDAGAGSGAGGGDAGAGTDTGDGGSAEDAARKTRGILTALLGAVMNWLLELLEVASGYLANTLSFMRVAGLGIAHVTLMTAFFEIASLAAGDGAAGDGGYGVVSIIILILGNALVIGLEGLSAGIQSLRLNYYEFFSKYFSGSGEAYRPISLTGRA